MDIEHDPSDTGLKEALTKSSGFVTSEKGDGSKLSGALMRTEISSSPNDSRGLNGTTLTYVNGVWYNMTHVVG